MSLACTWNHDIFRTLFFPTLNNLIFPNSEVKVHQLTHRIFSLPPENHSSTFFVADDQGKSLHSWSSSSEVMPWSSATNFARAQINCPGPRPQVQGQHRTCDINGSNPVEPYFQVRFNWTLSTSKVILHDLNRELCTGFHHALLLYLMFRGKTSYQTNLCSAPEFSWQHYWQSKITNIAKDTKTQSPNVLHLVIISLPSKHLKTSQISKPSTKGSLGLQLHELKQKHVLSTFSPRNKTLLWRSRTS